MDINIEKTTEESLVMAILELAGIFDKRGTNVTNAVGVTTQQWLVLLHLAEDPNIPNLSRKASQPPNGGWLASDLADSIHVSRPYMTTLVNILLEKQLIFKKDDERDQRKKRLFLTEEGKLAIQKLQRPRQSANTRLFEGVPKADREIMLKSLKKCLDNLKIPVVWS